MAGIVVGNMVNTVPVAAIFVKINEYFSSKFHQREVFWRLRFEFRVMVEDSSLQRYKKLVDG
jgi:hypothetical protein